MDAPRHAHRRPAHRCRGCSGAALACRVGGRRGRRPRRRGLGAARRRPDGVHGGRGPRLRASWCSVPPGRRRPHPPGHAPSRRGRERRATALEGRGRRAPGRRLGEERPAGGAGPVHGGAAAPDDRQAAAGGAAGGAQSRPPALRATGAARRHRRRPVARRAGLRLDVPPTRHPPAGPSGPSPHCSWAGVPRRALEGQPSRRRDRRGRAPGGPRRHRRQPAPERGLARRRRRPPDRPRRPARPRGRVHGAGAPRPPRTANVGEDRRADGDLHPRS